MQIDRAHKRERKRIAVKEEEREREREREREGFRVDHQAGAYSVKTALYEKGVNLYPSPM